MLAIASGIPFEDKLMGTVQLGSKVYNATNIITYKYDKELLEMQVIILFPLEEKICGKDLSWNIFINDRKSDVTISTVKTITINIEE